MENSASKNPNEKQCAICGEPAIYSYFGAIACQPCKVFFRRNDLIFSKFDRNVLVTIEMRFRWSLWSQHKYSSSLFVLSIDEMFFKWNGSRKDSICYIKTKEKTNFTRSITNKINMFSSKQWTLTGHLISLWLQEVHHSFFVLWNLVPDIESFTMIRSIDIKHWSMESSIKFVTLLWRT